VRIVRCWFGAHRFYPFPENVWAPLVCHRCGYSPDAGAVRRDAALKDAILKLRGSL
jgi:hypothetical protein